MAGLICSIRAAQRLDSRGNPTIQVDLESDKGIFRALVPSGASKGQYEAIELRDEDKHAYGGKGVLSVVDNIEKVIAPALIAKKFRLDTQLKDIDAFMNELDGTENKSRLGANAILGVSIACARAGAAAQNVPLYEFLRGNAKKSGDYILPIPFFNVLNGGAHSGNSMVFQEFMIAPVGAKSMADAVRMGAEVYHQLKSVLKENFGGAATGVGDEGGFAPPITTIDQACELLGTAVEQCGYTGKIKYGLDPASVEFYDSKSGLYDLGKKSKTADQRTSAQMDSLYKETLAKHPFLLLEDPFAEDDWAAWTEFHRSCDIQLVGDDLLATNPKRMRIAHDKKACNALLLKTNQIGSVSETIEAANLATEFGWKVLVSHRSGETTDDFIADLTVALGTGQLKSGSPCRGERVAKYNRLMDIEEELKRNGHSPMYAGSLL